VKGWSVFCPRHRLDQHRAPAEFAEVWGDSLLANAGLDRLAHRATVLPSEFGKSWSAGFDFFSNPADSSGAGNFCDTSSCLFGYGSEFRSDVQWVKVDTLDNSWSVIQNASCTDPPASPAVRAVPAPSASPSHRQPVGPGAAPVSSKTHHGADTLTRIR